MNLLENENTITQISGLEQKLSAVLKPVRPDPEYVNRLRHSLGNVPTTILERRSATDQTLFVVLGLAVGVTAAYLLHKWLKK